MPSMFKLCKCGKKIPLNKYMCDECKKLSSKFHNKQYDKFSRDKVSAKFYASSEWKKARAKIKREEPFCRVCGKKADVVDHIIPIKAGGKKLSRENLQSLCHKCHNEKTLNDELLYKDTGVVQSLESLS